jgi:sec-independent protein translocase protein TatA
MPFFGLHPIWAVAILIIVLILFGVGRLPSVGGALGTAISDFRRAVRGDQAAPPDPPIDQTKR